MLVLQEVHKAKVLEQVENAQKQVDVSFEATHDCFNDYQCFQRWREDRLLKEKEATALVEEDYELAENLNRQLNATRGKPEQNIISSTLAEVFKPVRKAQHHRGVLMSR